MTDREKCPECGGSGIGYGYGRELPNGEPECVPVTCPHCHGWGELPTNSSRAGCASERPRQANAEAMEGSVHAGPCEAACTTYSPGPGPKEE